MGADRSATSLARLPLDCLELLDVDDAVPGAKTWVPVDSPAAVADAIAGFVPAPVP